MSDVFITEALASRPVRASDFGAENDALLLLAAAMTHAPTEILPRLVALAMVLTGTPSAGFSSYEAGPAPRVFRWRHVCGLLAEYENATAPRDHSPCGVTLDRNTPTLATHPERIYEWIAATGLVIPEVLLVPLCIAGEEPLGTLWVVAGDKDYFHQGHADILTNLATFAGFALQMIRNDQRLHEKYDEQELLAREMSHRLKNVFAMTDGMIHISERHSTTVRGMAVALTGRLHALAKANSLIQQRVSALDEEHFTDLGTLLAAVTRVHDEDGDSPGRVKIAGPPVACGAHAANSLALLFHELTTNAAKYGALGEYGGRVEITWRHQDREIVLEWRELDGPPVAATRGQEGFGTLLVARTIKHQFCGRVDYDWAPTGLALALRFAADTFGH